MKTVLLIVISIFVFSCSAQQRFTMPSTKQDTQKQSPYLLQAGDKVELIVAQRQDLSGDYIIGPDGLLALPLAGSIEIKNLTREQAESKIESVLKKHYSTISIILKIKSYQSSAYYVIIGEIKQPGTYPIINRISLLKALGTAGGLSEDAAIGSIQLVRNAPDKSVININLHDILHSGDFSQDYILQKDDMIYVPRKTLAGWMYPLKQILPVVQVGLLALITVNQL